MEQHWYVDIFRALFGILDGIIYGLISTAYNLIEEIAHYKVFSTETIGEFTGRIYAILSIFMLFKVSFSFINYMINPDSFTDREKGVQKVIMNIVVMFIMLVMCPWGFEQLWNLQASILDENIIGNFIFADNSSTDQTLNRIQFDPVCGTNDTNQYSVAASNGDYIALMTLKGFFQFYTEDELGVGYKEYNSDFEKIADKVCDATTPDDLLVRKIYNADTATTFENWPSDDDFYLIHYRFIISTAVGVVVLLILVSFAMDIGMRVVKLSFLELMAPIPIISYIDPASGKNGMFKKWLREVGGTWASVFIRLLALFFAVSIIQKVGDLQYIGNLNNHEASFWVQLFVIIGALMFAKKLPQLITDITGIKLDGGFNINPMKKIREQALGGNFAAGAITGVAAGGLALAGGVVSNAANLGKNLSKNLKNSDSVKEGFQRTFFGTDKDGNTRAFLNGKTGIKAVGAGLRSTGRALSAGPGSLVGGGLSSVARAVYKGKDGKWAPLKNANAGITESSKKRNARDEGWGIGSTIHDKATDAAQIRSSTGTTNEKKDEIKALKMELENIKRDEQRYSLSLSNIESADGGKKASLYADAFKYKPVKDNDGHWTYQKDSPETYAQLMQDKFDFDVTAAMDSIRTGFETSNYNGYMGKTAREQERMITEWLDNEITRIYGDAALTKTEYDNYDRLATLRNQADLEGKKKEKDITKKQELLDNRIKKG